MKRLLVILFALLIASSANAQTTTTTLRWDFIGSTPAQVMTYNQAVRVDNVPLTTAPTCVTSGANTVCELNVGTLANGSHNFLVTTLVDGVERAASLTKTFPLTTLPGTGNPQPQNPRFTITIIISGT